MVLLAWIVPVAILCIGSGAAEGREEGRRNETLSVLDAAASAIVRGYGGGSEGLTLTGLNKLWTSVLARGSAAGKTTCMEGVDSAQCSILEECAGMEEIYDMATRQGEIIFDDRAVKDVCPLLLYRLQTGSCHDKDSSGEAVETKGMEGKKKPMPAEVWGYGVLFVTLISLCSLVGVSVLPLMGKKFYSKLLTGLVGLAVGSLSASSAFHLIPQSFGLLESDPEHSYLQKSLLILAGVWMFFMIERLLKLIMDSRQRKSQERRKATESTQNGGTEMRLPIDQIAEVERIYESQEQVIKASFGHQAKPERCHDHEHMVHWKSGDSAIETVAWMIIFGDGFHNFIDGLSIGAAFNESITTGISISVAVMCEELPHELGDFAVLLSAGMSMRQALLYNLLSACTCYLGLALGILLGEIEASVYIFGLAAGMFLYISLVDMVPEMNEVSQQASRKSVAQALHVLLLQNIGMFVGVAALYVLALFQDQIRFV